MKKDCSKTVIYAEEFKRMCDSYACPECPLGAANNGRNIGCDDFEHIYTEEAVAIVQKWSDEHPEETIWDEFLKNYPNAPLREDGIPRDVCPNDLGYNGILCGDYQTVCPKCWGRTKAEARK